MEQGPGNPENGVLQVLIYSCLNLLTRSPQTIYYRVNWIRQYTVLTVPVIITCGESSLPGPELLLPAAASSLKLGAELEEGRVCDEEERDRAKASLVLSLNSKNGQMLSEITLRIDKKI